MTYRINQILAIVLLFLSADSVSASFFSNFNFASLIYKIGICHHIGPICPAPPCRLPHPPDVCDYYDCDDGSDCNWKATESMCGGNSDCMASNEWYQGNSDSDGQDYFEDEGDSQLQEDEDASGSSYYDEEEEYEYNNYNGESDGYDGDGDGDGGEYEYYEEEDAVDGYDNATYYETAAQEGTNDRDSVSGGTNSANDHSYTSNVNYVPFIIAVAVVALFILIAVIRSRRDDELKDGELGEELSPGDEDLKGAVARRKEDVESGKIGFLNTPSGPRGLKGILNRPARTNKRPRRGHNVRFSRR